MPDLFTRFPTNPILRPSDVKPSRPGWEVTCLLNPGVFQYQGKTGLLLRVAERAIQEPGYMSTPILDPTAPGGARTLRVKLDDPDLVATDPRVVSYKGQSYLTTLSHLRLAWSTDGIHFTADETATLEGAGPLEAFGIEDCRVTRIADTYYLTYTAVSGDGHGVDLASTKDFKIFTRHGMILPPPNKDSALFPRKINGQYHILHRPSPHGLGGPHMWTASSPDLIHWGNHRCIARPRPNSWDDQRIGAGAEPIETEKGWLVLYHAANSKSRYSLGLMLLDLSDPSKVLARPRDLVMEPTAPYELTGFFGNVVFTNGHTIKGDTLTIYYGASDEVICAATVSIQKLLSTL